jgi:hypothetical protein
MNTILVNKACTVSVAGLATRGFALGEEVAPSSPYYNPIKWAGLGNDSGHESTVDIDTVFRPNEVVVSETDPHLAPGGVWIQELNGNNKDWTMWIALEG